MAQVEERTTEELRREIDAEREQLTSAVESLREEMGLSDKVRSRLPLFAAGAFCAGFVLAGGIGATMRLVFRRGRERKTLFS